MCWRPGDFPWLKHQNTIRTGTQVRCPISKQSADCKHRHAEKEKQRAHWGNWGSQYVYKYLMLNSAKWDSRGDVHRTHPALHLSKLWALTFCYRGGVGGKQQGTQGQKRMRKAGQGQSEASAAVNKSRQFFSPQWNVKCYFCINLICLRKCL